MASPSPLSPKTNSQLNVHVSTPQSTSRRYEKFEVRSYTTTTTSYAGCDGAENEIENDVENTMDSSPFVSDVKDDDNNTQQQPGQKDQSPRPHQTENEKPILSPIKTRPMSRVLSGTELSPLKILQEAQGRGGHGHERTSSLASNGGSSSIDEQLAGGPPPSRLSLDANSMPPPSSLRSPRKAMSPIKRFPVKISQPLAAAVAVEDVAATPRASAQAKAGDGGGGGNVVHERQMSLEDAIRENEGLKHAIEIFEDEVSVLESEGGNVGDDAQPTVTPVTSTTTSTAIATDGTHEREVEIDAMDHDDYEEDEPAGIDDTMISTFSTFSAVPNLTMLAHMRANGASPTKTLFGNGSTRHDMATPSRTPRPCYPASAATPATVRHDSGGNNTTNLIDFTEQLRFGTYGPTSPSSRRGRVSPSRAPANLLSTSGAATVASTPQRPRHSKSNSNNNNGSTTTSSATTVVNLLDFDIPPLPTPRSIPTITPRELESLKSGFLAEISSLKASLSGKAAEVASLKTAVADAETRVGASLEQLREARGRVDGLAAERDVWEKRGKDMEAVLRQVKDEIVLGARERDELELKLEEAEKRREAAEMMAQEAESKMAGMRAGRASSMMSGSGPSSPSPKAGGGEDGSGGGNNKEVELAVERVARELHALYKGKHETKVAALKKSYENRWEKKVRELQTRLDELQRENDELRVGRDATLTRVDPVRLAAEQETAEAERREREKAAARDAAQISGLEAEVEKLEAVVKSVQADNDELRVLLERERVEKGELVILAEEMMSMQQQQSFLAAAAEERGQAPVAATPTRTREMMPPPSTTGATGLGIAAPAASSRTTPGTTRHGTTRTSGLRAPAGMKASSSESRIGRVGGHERTKSVIASGVPRPGSGLGVRSGGIMSSIEKMGNYNRGRGGE